MAWKYGLCYKAKESGHVMNVVIETLNQLGVSFVIKGSDYCLKCSYGEANSQNSPPLEFMVQLYKADPEVYMIDLKRTLGSPLCFLDFSNKLKKLLDSKLQTFD